MSYQIALKPRISEKAYGVSQTLNTYVFVVPTDVNKMTVAHAVEEQFKVTVKSVNILNSKGKAKRTIRKGGRPVAGRRADTKKAYVTLIEGDSIVIFAAEDTEEKKPKAKKEKK